MTDEPEAGRDRLEIDNMYLCGSRFTRVSLKDAFFGDTHLIGAEVNDVNASEMTFENVNLSETRFHNVNMSEVKIENANLAEMTLTNVNLAGARIDNANIDGFTIYGVPVSDMLALWKEHHGTA